MSSNHYTVGLAGHIDHGKTTLTKAITNIDTDRLKAEKERNISIELGYAPLRLADGLEASIIDVPGHERFIRQMIAGVAGIDLVMLVVAADEGVMPQTKEHLDILSFLGIKHGLIVITKIDRVDEELLELAAMDIQEQVQGTIFEDSQVMFVDSLANKGIEALKTKLVEQLQTLPPRNMKGEFRLPIDQVFTVHGQGTVVRGTVYEGSVMEGDLLTILPDHHKVRARQLQVHHTSTKEGRAGQRVAVNLNGVTKDQVQRGDVLVSNDTYKSSVTIDISLEAVEHLKFPLKQRSFIKVHIGTAEVYGRIVFFDRNELADGEKVLCQLRLEGPVVAKRGDRFILRRPTPAETIGGGWVVDPLGEKYRFGEETIRQLQQKKEGSPLDRTQQVLRDEKALERSEIAPLAGLSEEDLDETLEKGIENGSMIETLKGTYALASTIETLRDVIFTDLHEFHENFPLRQGKNKAEMVQLLSVNVPKSLADWTVEYVVDEGLCIKTGQFVALATFKADYPDRWRKRMEQVLQELESQQLQVDHWTTLMKQHQIPAELSEDVKHFWLERGDVFELDEKQLVHGKVFYDHVKRLKNGTDDSFSLKEAKDILGVSRKVLVPFLERLDRLKLTVREDTMRKWLEEHAEQWFKQKQ